jgi:flavin reductase (DIM6/NTAB) family NADH-FMN oxidoreductase RutF
VPRPIGWIATVDRNGVPNLAPYSFFNAVSDRPPVVLFASGGHKDSLRNIEDNGEFVFVASQDLVDAMNLSSAAVYDVSEYGLAGLATAPSLVVAPPRVAASRPPQCRLWNTTELPGVDGKPGPTVVFGHVVAVFVDERIVKDGLVDTAAMRPLARMGYMDYAVVTPETTFTLNRPRVSDDRRTATVTPGPWDGVYR